MPLLGGQLRSQAKVPLSILLPCMEAIPTIACVHEGTSMHAVRLWWHSQKGARDAV